ncbi:DUF2269 family protein [Paenibacillus chondroitinus]|uniref:DUF2269 family protein n=1 Tax=Paenibacillus chondroitinus TaxID=59842 RepID=A0ABU6D7I1_9BACL|nr:MULTISPECIES: DUF2269 family protein [Paenibacillus]MCY9661590.1 DUF2269 domain-containing protein [Paenibacillus anseongense]MEB4793675.1 DUF2269 family protein [Paenibacillus chondroitinus]
MYIYLLFVHILAAVIAMAAVICYPLIMSSAKTTSQAKFALALLEKAAILPKLGGTLLLLTGLALGFLEVSLFKELWYVLSIAIFLVILVIFAGLIPAGIKQQRTLLQQTPGDDLPDAYRQSRRRSARLDLIANLAAFIVILLMVFKP